MARFWRIAAVLSALCVALAAMAMGATAAKPHGGKKAKPKPTGARVDPSYGLDGSYAVATGKPEGYEGQPTHLALAKDGEAYVLQGTAVTAFTPDGKPDHSFGKNGRLRVELGPGQLKAVSGIAVDSAGRVLVAGTYEPFPGTVDRLVKGNPGFTSESPVTEAFVARYLSDGGLDPSFGTGGVQFTTAGVPRPTDMVSYATRGDAEYERPSVTVTKLAVDSQDRPVIAGEYVDAFVGCGWASQIPQSFVGRLTATGAVDSSFGGTGYVKLPGAEMSEIAVGPESGIAALSDEIYPCSEHERGPDFWTTSALNESGLPTIPLGVTPKVGLHDGLTVDGQGRILYFEQGGPKVVRLLPSGAFDTSFGSDGGANLKQFKIGSIPDMAVDAKDRPVLVMPGKEPKLLRLTAAGKVDHAFAKKGVVGATVSRVDAAYPQGIAIDFKGRIVVAGTAEGGSLKTGWGISVTRFLPGK